MSDSRPHWSKNSKIDEALRNNGITIVPLTSANKDALLKMVLSNRLDDGFKEMRKAIFDGRVFEKILTDEEKSAEKCLVATKKFTDDIVGFVVFETEGKQGFINELGVDKKFRHGNPEKVKNAGTSLLFVACNEMASVTDIGTLASTDEAAKFYEKNGFVKMDEEDSELEYSFSTDQYDAFEAKFLARSLPQVIEAIEVKETKFEIEPERTLLKRRVD